MPVEKALVYGLGLFEDAVLTYVGAPELAPYVNGVTSFIIDTVKNFVTPANPRDGLNVGATVITPVPVPLFPIKSVSITKVANFDVCAYKINDGQYARGKLVLSFLAPLLRVDVTDEKNFKCNWTFHSSRQLYVNINGELISDDDTDLKMY